MGFNDNQYDPAPPAAFSGKLRACRRCNFEFYLSDSALFCSRCCAESGVEDYRKEILRLMNDAKDDEKTRAVLHQEIESLKGDNTRLKRWRDNLLDSLRNGCRLEWTERGGFRSFPDNLQAKVNELEKLREGDSELIRALAKDVGIEITAPNTSPGTQWEQFHTGVTDLKECWNNQRKTILENHKTIQELEDRSAALQRRAWNAEQSLKNLMAEEISGVAEMAREIGRLRRVGRKALELLKQFAGMGFVKAQHLTIEIEEALKLAIKTEEALK